MTDFQCMTMLSSAPFARRDMANDARRAWPRLPLRAAQPSPRGLRIAEREIHSFDASTTLMPSAFLSGWETHLEKFHSSDARPLSHAGDTGRCHGRHSARADDYGSDQHRGACPPPSSESWPSRAGRCPILPRQDLLPIPSHPLITLVNFLVANWSKLAGGVSCGDGVTLLHQRLNRESLSVICDSPDLAAVAVFQAGACADIRLCYPSKSGLMNKHIVKHIV